MIFARWVDWLVSQLAPQGLLGNPLVIYVGLLVAAAVLLFFLAVRQFIGTHSQTAERLETLVAMERAEADEARSRRPDDTWLGRLVMKLSISKGIASDLDRANVALSVPEYVLIIAGLALVAFTIGLLRGSFVVGLLLGGIAVLMARMWVSRRGRKRRQAFARQINDIINLIVGSLRAGYGVMQSMSMVTQEMPPPASDEIARIVRAVQLGLPLNAALDRSAERLQNDDWSLVVTSIKIQTEVGGNLAEVLETVAATIRERIRILGEIRVMTTQQRLTGWVLTLLPVGLAVILFIINPDYMSGLFSPGLPIMLAVAGAAGIVVGAIVIRRIVAIDV